MGSTLKRLAERMTLDVEPFADLYWTLVPRYHRLRRHWSERHVDPPIDPFELAYVDPDRITRFTGREYPVWRSRWQDFGAVIPGDWDLRRDEEVPVAESYAGPEPSLYLAETFSETVVHRSLEAHFVDGVDWEETELIREVTDRIRTGETSGSSVWHTCSTVPEIRERCRYLDRLYRSMRRHGCLSARELSRTDRGRRRRFPQVMLNEILVDVGRDGELLFVTGRHRLSIAKILDLERVPVAFVVRHPGWLERRTELRERSSERLPEEVVNRAGIGGVPDWGRDTPG